MGSIFLDQIEARRQNDERMFEQAFADLCSIIDERRDRSGEVARIKDAIGEILSYYKQEPVDISSDESMEEARQLELMLGAAHLSKHRVELTGEWWKDADGPILGNLEDGGVVAFIPTPFGGYTYRDASGKRVRVGKRARVKGDAFCFYRLLPDRPLNMFDFFKFMWDSLSRSDSALILLCTVVVTLLGLITPAVTQFVYDTIVPGGVEGDIPPIAALLTGTVIGVALFNVIKSLLSARRKNQASLAVQNAVMHRLFNMPADFYKEYTSGELSHRAGVVSDLCTTIFDTILGTSMTGLFSLIYIFQMVRFAPSLVVPAVLILLASLALNILLTLMQMKIIEQAMEKEAALKGTVYGMFSGVQKIKLAGAEKRMFSVWAKSYREIGKLRYAPPVVLRISRALVLAAQLGGMVWIYYSAAKSGVSVADYMAFSTSFGMVSAAFVATGLMTEAVGRIKPMYDMLSPILTAVPETSEGKKAVSRLSGNIEFNNTTFRYSEDSPPVIDGLDLKIRAREYVAIVGRTGCGKSTLMRLMLGFEQPELGAIYYDGADLSTLDLTTARQCIGVSLQDGKLFAGDLFSNIVIAAPWKTLDDAWEAAELAEIAGDIRDMPMGMHTLVPDGGGGFSGGQKQRLLIARALVAKPRILLLDEATSALDNITQKKISDNIAALRCTRIVIAHRLSTIRQCDRIIVLDKGKVAEEGSFSELMDRRGMFYELVEKQTI